MTKSHRFSGNQCFVCGRQCIPKKDAFGGDYMGCPNCRVVSAPSVPEAPEPAKASGWAPVAVAEGTVLEVGAESGDYQVRLSCSRNEAQQWAKLLYKRVAVSLPAPPDSEAK